MWELRSQQGCRLLNVPPTEPVHELLRRTPRGCALRCCCRQARTALDVAFTSIGERSTMTVMKGLSADSSTDRCALRAARTRLERVAISVLLAIGAAALIGRGRTSSSVQRRMHLAFSDWLRGMCPARPAGELPDGCWLHRP